MRKVALVTCRELPEPDVDEQILLEACQGEGLDACYVAWDDATIDWSQFEVAAVRSTWNYHLHERAFRAWIAETSTATRLWNPPGVMLANIDKRYLSAQREAGVPTVPTRFIERESAFSPDEWEEFVLKPVVSAGSHLTRRFCSGQREEARLFLREILIHSPAMMQPFLHRVAEGGEISLIHIDGELSHAVVKAPRFAGDEECVSDAVTPSPEQRAIAEKAMGVLKEPWLYARVDLLLDDGGTWLLSELEAIEPSLFLRQRPSAATRLARALASK